MRNNGIPYTSIHDQVVIHTEGNCGCGEAHCEHGNQTDLQSAREETKGVQKFDGENDEYQVARDVRCW
jgi:hypothetical protein